MRIYLISFLINSSFLYYSRYSFCKILLKLLFLLTLPLSLLLFFLSLKPSYGDDDDQLRYFKFLVTTIVFIFSIIVINIQIFFQVLNGNFHCTYICFYLFLFCVFTVITIIITNIASIISLITFLIYPLAFDYEFQSRFLL